MKTGAGKTVQCAICRGPNRKGLGNMPGIVGRSPSYMVRQLYDLKSGARAGPFSSMMKPVVADLSVDEMAQIAAYLATQAL